MRPMKKVLRMAVMALLTGCSASRTASFRTDYLGIDITQVFFSAIFSALLYSKCLTLNNGKE